ncbi:MAG: zinc ribbon domain-containing protein [Muribaculaceae bacterium]
MSWIMVMMNRYFCQSCGMPLSEGVLGTNGDGSANEEYCVYCYRDGKFTQDFTMEEMVDFCVKFVDQMNAASGTNYTAEEARELMMQYFPSLKRWRK